jgi:hypothetical protein
MKTYVNLWQYLTEFILEWGMFRTDVEKIKTHIVCSITFFLTFICLRWSYIPYDLASRTVRSWRQNSVLCFSQCWPWNALRNRMFGGACCGKSGGREIIINAVRWGAWYYSIMLNACRVTSMADTGIDAVKHVLLLRISFLRILVVLYLRVTCICVA